MNDSIKTENGHPLCAVAPGSAPCNRFVSMWHGWRANTLALKLQVQTERCNLLQIAERAYCSSYYTDKLHDAVCRRIEIAGALQYHKAKLLHANVAYEPRSQEKTSG